MVWGVKGEEALGCSLSHGCLFVGERTDVHEEEDERFASGLLGQLGQPVGLVFLVLILHRKL